MGNAYRSNSWTTTNKIDEISGRLGPTEPVPFSSYSTYALKPSDQFEFWRSSASNMAVIDRPGAANEPFQGSVSSFFTSRMAFSHHETRHPSILKRDQSFTDNMGADIVAVQLRLKGQETANSFNHRRHFMPGDIRLFDLSRPYSSENLLFENLAIVLEHQKLEPLLPRHGNWHGLILPDGPMVGLLSQHMQSTFATLSGLPVTEAELLSKITTDILTATLMNALPDGMRDAEYHDRASLITIRQFIDSNLHRSDLSPTMVARGIGVSRAKLFRLCRTNNESPMDMIRQQRLKRALCILRSNKCTSITELAYDVGFEHRETFSRQFKEEFGFSAQEMLMSVRHGGRHINGNQAAPNQAWE